ncbi:MAG: polyketide cyclase / dehydrase and lipid transport [Sciscionella sp.]|nr:polyketide cyclase / dehydrase and lipid transport [Sciscionella sp.]
MPAIDVVDETFIVAPAKIVAAACADRDNWRSWWPDLRLEVYADRGDEGLRWTVRGALIGTMEVWLEPMLDGVLLHYFLRADVPDSIAAQGKSLAKLIGRERANRPLAAKRMALSLKRSVENNRQPGCPSTFE